jgi:hypothetical protein
VSSLSREKEKPPARPASTGARRVKFTALNQGMRSRAGRRLPHLPAVINENNYRQLPFSIFILMGPTSLIRRPSSFVTFLSPFLPPPNPPPSLTLLSRPTHHSLPLPRPRQPGSSRAGAGADSSLPSHAATSSGLFTLLRSRGTRPLLSGALKAPLTSPISLVSRDVR